MIHRFLCLLPGLLAATILQAQILSQEPAPGVLIGLDYNLQWPLADMADRFGSNSSIGMGLHYKTMGNWIFGVDADYFFGSKIKQDSFVINLLTNDGVIVGTNGETANVVVHERGYIVSPKISRVIPLREKNQNSGIILQFGAGIMTHWIKIVDVENIVPQLRSPYHEGYDRLTQGIALSQFVGYLNLDRNKLLNFYVGLELVQGFNKGQRDYLFDVQRAGTESRFDVLFGIKAGWILPIYGKRDDDYYYQ